MNEQGQIRTKTAHTQTHTQKKNKTKYLYMRRHWGLSRNIEQKGDTNV